jgi:hypothetical protein
LIRRSHVSQNEEGLSEAKPQPFLAANALQDTANIDYPATMRAAVSIAAGILLALTVEASAQKYTWRCDFPGYSEPITYVFDSETEKGFAIGNVGTADLNVHLGDLAITFMGPIPTGAVQTTTIMLKSGAAIHSRHTITEKDFFPSQVRGTCKHLI